MNKLKSAAAASEVAPQPRAAEDDPNDLLAAIRRAGNKDRLKKVSDPAAAGRARKGTKSLSNEGNTLATALAQLRFQVGDSDSDDDGNEISDDEWD